MRKQRLILRPFPFLQRTHGALLVEGDETLLVGLWDGSVWAYDGATGARQRQLRTAESPKLSRLVPTDEGGALLLDRAGRLSRYRPGAQGLETIGAPSPVLDRLYHHGTEVDDAALSPDGTLIASASAIGCRMVHEVDTGRVLWMKEGFRGTGTLSNNPIEFSPDGMLLVYPQRRVWVENDVSILAGVAATTGEALWPEVITAERVQCLSWSPDGRYLAMATPTRALNYSKLPEDQRVSALLLDAAGRRVAGYKGLKENAQRMTFSPCGRFLILAAYESPLAIWKVPEDPRAIPEGPPITPCSKQSQISVPDLSPALRCSSYDLDGRAGAICFDSGGNLVVVTEGSPRTRTPHSGIDTTSYGDLFRLPFHAPEPFKRTYPPRDGQRLHRVLGRLTELRYVNEEELELVGESGHARWKIGSPAAASPTVAVVPPGERLVWSHSREQVLLWSTQLVDPRTGEAGRNPFSLPEREFDRRSQFRAFSANDRWIFARFYGESLQIRDQRTWQLHKFEYPKPPQGRWTRLSPSHELHCLTLGQSMLVGTCEGALLFDLSEPIRNPKCLAPDREIFRFASDREGRIVAWSQNGSEEPLLFGRLDRDGPWVRAPQDTTSDSSTAMAGGRVAIAAGARVVILDAEKLELDQVVPVAGATGEVVVALRADGRQLAMAPASMDDGYGELVVVDLEN